MNALSPWIAILGLVSMPAIAEEPEHGVVIESVGKGSSLEKAGIQPGDLFLSWKRLPAPPANPEAAEGRFENVFEWYYLVDEQAPRGPVVLKGERNGAPIEIEVPIGLWEAEVRPTMPQGIKVIYVEGKNLLEGGQTSSGIEHWEKLLQSENLKINREIKNWTSLNIGNLLSNSNEWDKSIKYFFLALNNAVDVFSKIIILESIGHNYVKQSDFDKARDYFVRAKEMYYESWGHGAFFAKILSNEGELARVNRELELAEKYYLLAHDILKEVAPNSLQLAKALNDLGILASMNNDFRNAENLFIAALKLRRTLAPNSVAVAGSLNNLGIVYKKIGNIVKAEHFYKQALEILEKLKPGSLSVAACLNNLGIIAQENRNLREAEYYFRGALNLRKRHIPNSLPVADTSNTLGNLAIDRGDLAAAKEFYEDALEIREKLVPNSEYIASSFQNLGILMYLQDDFQVAEKYWLHALEIMEDEVPNRLDLVGLFDNLGVVTWYLTQDISKAMKYMSRSLEIKKSHNPESLAVATTLSNIGSLAWVNEDLDIAETFLIRSLNMREKLAPRSLDLADSLHNIGIIEEDRGNLELALNYFQQSLSIWKEQVPGSYDEGETLLMMAKTLRKLYRFEEAFDCYNLAISTIENQIGRVGGFQSIKIRFRDSKDKYYKDFLSFLIEKSEFDLAISLLERSSSRILHLLINERDIVLSYQQISDHLENKIKSLGYQNDLLILSQLNLDQSNYSDTRQELFEKFGELRREYDYLIEQIRRESPRLAEVIDPQPLDLQGVQAMLDPGTLLLSFGLLADQSVLFAVTRDSFQHYLIPKGEAEIEALVDQWRGPGTDPKTEKVGRDISNRVAHRLYRDLLEPARAEIDAAERLVIVADGPLRTFPFQALVTAFEAGKPRYLIEEKPMTNVVSATIYAELKKRPKRGLTRLAAFGDPLYPEPEKGSSWTDWAETLFARLDFRAVNFFKRRGYQLERLPYTADEAAGIAARFGEKGTAYLRYQATEDRAKALDKDLDVVHFACHGEVNERFPLDSFLALSINQDFEEGEENGLLQAWEIFERVRLDAELVVLSACNSGTGKDFKGEGLMGLTRAFQYAGARSIVASYWPISDATTAVFMDRFYGHLKAGLDKAEALRQTQIELIRRPLQVKRKGWLSGLFPERTVDAAHPYFWAAFQLIGPWD